jgi:RHS repeat-associated protein
VFFVYPLETIDFHYERKLVDVGGEKLADPRVSHQMTLEVDDYGNVERSVAIGYPRRLVPDCQPEQTETHIILTVNRFINSPELPIKFPDRYSPEYLNWYRVGVPSETQTYELVKPPEPVVTDTSVALFKFEDIRTLTEGLFGLDRDEPDPSKTIPYEKWNWRKAPPGETKLRLIEHVRTLYRKNDLSGFLPLEQLDSLALPYESYKLAFTPNLVTQIYEGRVTDTMPNDDGKYVHSEGDSNWWIPSGHIFYSPNKNDSSAQELAFAQQHFFLPHRSRDPFDQEMMITYDGYDLLMLESEDPLHNKVTAGERDALGNIANINNYSVLQPALVTDPNGNRSSIAFDALGMVVGTAVMGKPGENKGDSLTDFEPDLGNDRILAHIQYPLTDPHDILQKATTRLVYDLYAYYRTCDDPQPQPAVVYTLGRETQDADLAPGQLTKIQHSFSYSDGFGREIQKKIQAEPGDVEGVPTDPRWVGTGWMIFNNKGKPVRKYEPFFDDTHEFRFGKEVGVSPILFYDPVERVVATLYPNNTYEKVVFDPWHKETWDVNDTVIGDPRTDTDISGYVAEYFEQIAPEPDTWETWLQQRGVDPLAPPQDVPGLDPEKKAAVHTLPHADTPTIAFVDSLGRTFLTVAHNRFERRTNGAVAIIEEKYSTRVVIGIEGNQREVIDAKERIVMRYDYDMLGSPIHQASMEAGERWTLNDVAGSPIHAWDSRGHALTMEYDAVRRPTRRFVEGTDPVHSDPRTVGNRILYEKVVYGEDYPGGRAAAAEQNLLTRAWKQFDSAGVVTSETYDFKGNLLRSSRRLVRDYKTIPDWDTFHEPEDLPDAWEEELFQSSTRYDALNRPIQLVAPYAGSETDVIQPGYNEANLLERLDVWLKHAGEPAELLAPDIADEHFVTNIDYNARGQRTLIQYGNDAETRYRYDPVTFRLVHLYTRRGVSYSDDCGDDPSRYPAPDMPPQDTPPCGLQNLHYTYDPAGNITAILDDAQHTIYFNGEVVRPDAEYKYDALYRLIEACGREHIGQASEPQATWHDRHRVNLAHPNDGQAMRNYFEFYKYDEVGNILKFDHKAHGGNWIRAYEYDEPSLIELDKKSNRLSCTVVHPNGNHPISEPYTYDLHGNMTSMPHLPQMVWDFKDQMQMVDKGGGCMAYYVYDAGGQRVRKVIERQNGNLQKQRIYLGGFEVYREYNGSGAHTTLERESLHVMDDQQRIALVETRTQGDDGLPQRLIRYQLGNHLGSASLELDSEAQVISYEEYYPYGSSSYQAVRSQTETPKRYRYTGMERDEETGFNYHSARYYAVWLGRWISTDPIGLRGGTNLYGYPLCNPIRVSDVTGTGPFEELLQQYTSESGIEVEFQGESGETVQLRARLDLSSEDEPEIVLMHGEGETRIPASLENIEGTGLGAFISPEDIPTLQTASGGISDVYLGLGQRFALSEASRMAQGAEELQRAISPGARSGMPIGLIHTTDMFENTTMPAAVAAQQGEQSLIASTEAAAARSAAAAEQGGLPGGSAGRGLRIAGGFGAAVNLLSVLGALTAHQNLAQENPTESEMAEGALGGIQAVCGASGIVGGVGVFAGSSSSLYLSLLTGGTAGAGVASGAIAMVHFTPLAIEEYQRGNTGAALMFGAGALGGAATIAGSLLLIAIGPVGWVLLLVGAGAALMVGAGLYETFR